MKKGVARGTLCDSCKAGVQAFPEAALLFNAILYVRGAAGA